MTHIGSKLYNFVDKAVKLCYYIYAKKGGLLWLLVQLLKDMKKSFY